MKRICFVLLLFAVLAVSAHAQASPGFTKLGNVSTASYTDTACPDQTTCYYEVTSVDSGGFESAPATCSATALCIGGNTAVAGMPSSGTHTVSLTWTAPPVGSSTVTFNVYVHRGPLSGTGMAATVN